jgi:DNA-binding NarL/FixJ family response regulator
MSTPTISPRDVAVAVPDSSLSERAQRALGAAGYEVRPLATPVAAAAVRPGEVLVLGAAAGAPDACAALRSLHEASAELAVVVLLSAASAGPAVRRAMRAGASGIVLEPDLERALAATVGAVAGGQTVTPRADRRLARPALSVRERQVLSLVVMGLMNGEIAAQLFVAESTVKSHLSSAFAKLGVRSRTEAIELILDPDEDAGLGILRIGGEPLTAVAEAS